MSERTIGTCSICGGPVCVPDPWFGTAPPMPSCRECNAKPSQPYGPTIPMTRPILADAKERFAKSLERLNQNTEAES